MQRLVSGGLAVFGGNASCVRRDAHLGMDISHGVSLRMEAVCLNVYPGSLRKALKVLGLLVGVCTFSS